MRGVPYRKDKLQGGQGVEEERLRRLNTRRLGFAGHSEVSEVGRVRERNAEQQGHDTAR